MRRGPTWEQFLDALSHGRSSAYLLILFLVMVAGLIVAKELSEWKAKAVGRDPVDPEALEWLNSLSPSSEAASPKAAGLRGSRESDRDHV